MVEQSSIGICFKLWPRNQGPVLCGDAPDSTVGFVTPRVAKIHFTMLNNRVEPIRNVDRSIRALAHINRPKRRVIGFD